MKRSITGDSTMEAKTIWIYLKVSDGFESKFLNQQNEIIGRYEGYVPGFFPDEHGGDYVSLKIDLATGKILNWQPPTEAEIDELLSPQPKHPVW
jgi:hypothetical protein